MNEGDRLTQTFFSALLYCSEKIKKTDSVSDGQF